MRSRALSGKRVLITGAGGGIGSHLAHVFAKAGNDLVLTDLDSARLDQASRRLSSMGVSIQTRAMDVSDRSAVESLARWVVDELGGLDILINNAGVGFQAELAETSLETWKKLLDVNFLGPLYHVHAFLPHFKQKRSGHIVNVSSGQAFFRLPTWGAYAAVKAALGVFSEVLCFELRKHHIRVTTVYPFLVNTPFYENIQAPTPRGRFALSLIPYCSMSPEQAARIIFKAVSRRAKVEYVSRLNDLGRIQGLIPFARDLLSRASHLLLAQETESRP